jgi:hypothetical protein
MQFIFSLTQVNREALLKYPYAALDGDLTILLNDEVFFREEVSLLGFALSVHTWLANIKTGSFADFEYSSDEYTENPVLRLTKVDSHRYTISSAWAINYPETMLELREITQCFEAFLRELDALIRREYGVGFSDMRLFTSR